MFFIVVLIVWMVVLELKIIFKGLVLILFEKLLIEIFW